jgi:hypothetical protein
VVDVVLDGFGTVVTATVACVVDGNVDGATVVVVVSTIVVLVLVVVVS